MIPNAVCKRNGGTGFEAQSTGLKPSTFTRDGNVSFADDIEKELLSTTFAQESCSSFVDVHEKALKADMSIKVGSTSDSPRDLSERLGAFASFMMNAWQIPQIPAVQQVENQDSHVTSEGDPSRGMPVLEGQTREVTITLQTGSSSARVPFLPNGSLKQVPDEGDMLMNGVKTAAFGTVPSQHPDPPSEAPQSKQNAPPFGVQNGMAEPVDGQKMPVQYPATNVSEAQDSDSPLSTNDPTDTGQDSVDDTGSSPVSTGEQGDAGGGTSNGDDANASEQGTHDLGGDAGGGMPDAQWQVPMKKMVEMDQMTRHSRQEMPSESFSAVNRESRHKTLADVSEMAHSNGALQMTAPVFDQSPAHMSHVVSAGDHAAAPTSTWERVVDVVQAQAVQMHRINATTVDAVIKPDDQTELHLRMHWNGTQMEAQLRCEQGQTGILQQHWDQLRDSLAAKGVVLTAWESQHNISDGSFADGRQRSHQPAVVSDAMEGSAFRGASNTKTITHPKEAAAIRQDRQWETWA